MPSDDRAGRDRRPRQEAPAELRRPTARAPNQDMAKETESDIPVEKPGEPDPVAHNVAAANAEADAEAGAPRRRPS